VTGNGDAVAARLDDALVALARERLVRENLAARLGSLTAENIDLLLRIHELEHPPVPTEEVPA
jgi:hypothetical protein